MAKIEEIRGTAEDSLTDGATTITAEQDGAPTFFIADPNFTDRSPLLVVLRGLPFRLIAEAWAPRGLLAELTVSKQTEAKAVQAAEVASVETFDPESTTRLYRAVLDRWDDGSNCTLAAAAGLEVARDNEGTLATDRKAALLQVHPLIAVEAAGVVWGRSGPTFERDRFRRLAAALGKLPGGKPYTDVTTAQLEVILTEAEQMVEELQRTDDIFTSREALAPRERAVATVSGGVRAGAAAAGSVAVGGLVHGPVAPRRDPRVPIVPREKGTSSSFKFRILVCESPDQVAALRNVQPWVECDA